MYNPSRTAQFAATPYDFRPTEPQLPIRSYCDPAIYECEQELIFRHCANYIGHEKMVPELGDWYALPHE
jgi:choline monooxygenase